MIDYQGLETVQQLPGGLPGQNLSLVEQVLHYFTGVLHDDAMQLGCHIERLLRDTLVHIPCSAPSYTAVTEAANLTNILVSRLRAIATELYGPSREGVVLLPALQMLLQNIEQETGLCCTLMNDTSLADRDIGYEREQVLYEVAQEAIRNAVKHARATTLCVTLSQEDSQLCLNVRDNGRGFTPLPASELLVAGHFGLALLQERIGQLEGTLQIDSARGEGTSLTVRVPVTCSSDGRRDACLR